MHATPYRFIHATHTAHACNPYGLCKQCLWLRLKQETLTFYQSKPSAYVNKRSLSLSTILLNRK